MEATAQSPIYPNSSEKGSFFKRPNNTPRSSTRSSIRASPAAFLSLKRKGNRYDQLESDFDHLELAQNPTKPERDHESESSDAKEISDVENVNKNTSQYMTLINENHSDDNLCSFENEVFVSPSECVRVKKRTPPPIPKRRSSSTVNVDSSANSSSENGRFPFPTKQSSVDVCSISSGEALRCAPPANTTTTSSNSHRDSPLPILPAPPSVKRNNSRKDRKRPAHVDSFVRNSLRASLNSNNSKSFGGGGGTLGDRLFPCGTGDTSGDIKETPPRRTISSSPSSSECNPLNPFLPLNRNSIVSSSTFSSIATSSANSSQYSGPFDTTLSSRQISSSVSQPDYSSILHPQLNSTWSCHGGVDCNISVLQKPLEESSDDGSSLLLPLSTAQSATGRSNRRRSMPEVTATVSDPECITVTVNSGAEQSESNSDFEVNDLVFDKYDSDSNTKLAVGSHTNLFQGSTNNLAEFEDNELTQRHRPVTLDISSNPFIVDSTENISPDTPTPCSSQSQTRLADGESVEHDPFSYISEQFPTAQLLQPIGNSGGISHETTNRLNESENEVDQTVFNAYVKLPRVRRRRIRARSWRPVQINLSGSNLEIFSEDARLIDTVELFTDEQLSSVCVDNCEDGLFHVIKILRVVYKAKRSWGDGIAVRGYSEYRAHESGFSKHVSRSRQILKIATRDYLSVHSLAKAISKLLLKTNQISEDVDLITPSPYCRIVLEVCDEMSCLINEEMELVPSQTTIESSIRVLTFGAERVSVAFNDQQLNIDRFERRDLICGAPERTIQPVNILTHSTANDIDDEDGYLNQRIVKFTPTNGTKIELMRFTTTFQNQKLPVMLKAEYSISGKCLSITCSLHLDQEIQIEPIEAIVIRLPLLKSWRTILDDESAFMSTTVGTCHIEGDWLIWRINRIPIQTSMTSNTQQFLSFSFKGFQLGSHDGLGQHAYLEFETSSASASGTRLRAISIQSARPRDEHEKLVNYRSHFFARVAIRFVMH